MRKLLAILFAGLVLVATVAPAADARSGRGGGNQHCICLPAPEIE